MKKSYFRALFTSTYFRSCSLYVNREVLRVVAKHAKEGEMEENETSRKIIGAAIEVHRVLGHGLLESAYEMGLEKELYNPQQYLDHIPTISIA